MLLGHRGEISGDFFEGHNGAVFIKHCSYCKEVWRG